MEETRDSFGFVRRLGNRPSSIVQSRSVRGWPKDMGQTIDRKKWKDMQFFVWPENVAIRDQGQTGSCNGHAAATSLEFARHVCGLSPQRLSPWYVYSILCKGIDSGSNILEALRLLSENGTCRDSDLAQGTINPKRIPKPCHEIAKRFRIEIGARLETWDEIVTATILRMPINLSVRVGNRFSDIDIDGVPPAAIGQANHAVCSAGGLKVTRKGEIAILCANSWGTKWGMSGFFWITERHFINSSYFEAYMVSAAKDDDSDQNALPKI